MTYASSVIDILNSRVNELDNIILQIREALTINALTDGDKNASTAAWDALRKDPKKTLRLSVLGASPPSEELSALSLKLSSD